VPSVEPSSTTTISLSNGTACTRFSSSSTVARSLHTGITIERRGTLVGAELDSTSPVPPASRSASAR